MYQCLQQKEYYRFIKETLLGPYIRVHNTLGELFHIVYSFEGINAAFYNIIIDIQYLV